MKIPTTFAYILDQCGGPESLDASNAWRGQSVKCLPLNFEFCLRQYIVAPVVVAGTGRREKCKTILPEVSSAHIPPWCRGRSAPWSLLIGFPPLQETSKPIDTPMSIEIYRTGNAMLRDGSKVWKVRRSYATPTLS